jgi:hypothetical protein
LIGGFRPEVKAGILGHSGSWLSALSKTLVTGIVIPLFVRRIAFTCSAESERANSIRQMYVSNYALWRRSAADDPLIAYSQCVVIDAPPAKPLKVQHSTV